MIRACLFLCFIWACAWFFVMTFAFLDDKDAGTPEEKISAYYHYVVLPQNLPQE